MAFWIFQNVVITAALAAAVALVCRSGRIGPVARHALWLIVLIKFITPPLVVWPWAAPDPLGISALDARAASTGFVETPGARVEVAGGSGPLVGEGKSLIGADVVAKDRVATDGADPAVTWTTWALIVWVAGSVVLLGIEAVRLVRLARRIRSGDVAPADSEIVRRVRVQSARLGINPVTVVIVPGAASPVVWGFGRPMLLWPAELPAGSTENCVDGLLVHELAHVKRRDYLIGWIELVAGVAWWWNPLFWRVRSARREQAELACDAWVISALPNGRRAYAESLLALSGAAACGASSMSSSMAAVGVHATSRRVLERRLVMIMKGRAPLRLPSTGLFCLALIGAATLPAWATSAQNPPPPPPPPSSAPVVVAAPAPAPAPVPAQTRAPQPVPVSQPAPASRARTAVRAGVPVGVVTGVPGAVTAPAPVGAASTRIVSQQTPPPPPPPPTAPPAPPAPARKAAAPPSVVTPSGTWTVKTMSTFNLPDEGKQLVESFNKDRVAIEAEVAQKIAARREAAVKALEALQEQYTKAGKLDEAVAIRDYLRAGGPGSPVATFFKRK